MGVKMSARKPSALFVDFLDISWGFCSKHKAVYVYVRILYCALLIFLKMLVHLLGSNIEFTFVL